MERKSTVKESAQPKKKKPPSQQPTLTPADLFQVPVAGVYRSNENQAVGPLFPVRMFKYVCFSRHPSSSLPHFFTGASREVGVLLSQYAQVLRYFSFVENFPASWCSSDTPKSNFKTLSCLQLRLFASTQCYHTHSSWPQLRVYSQAIMCHFRHGPVTCRSARCPKSRNHAAPE